MWNKWDDDDDNYDQTITLCEINEMMMSHDNYDQTITYVK